MDTDDDPDTELRGAQRRRAELVRRYGFRLTGPGHGAPAPKDMTLRQRFRDRFTHYSKPVATIDGRRQKVRADPADDRGDSPGGGSGDRTPPPSGPVPQGGAAMPRQTLQDVDKVAAQERADRTDPDLKPLMNSRDHEAAGGRFDSADASQDLIDALRGRSAERRVRDAGLDKNTRANRAPGREIGD